MTSPELSRRSATYRLSTAGGRFRWTTGRTEVASAVWRDHCWDIHRSEDDAVLLSLVGGSLGGRTRIALVDHESRRAATFSAGEPMSRSNIGVVRDSWDAAIMVVRADGPTGLHIINPAGELLALSSRRRPPDAPGCDILVTAEGATQGALMFGVTLALELLRAGALHRVA
ncbi:MAG TPA: hypothetical protein VHM89_16125 [Acidimicrobiales bacterium]|nr:hypothetical protein [Acidimicrobiales bacterium]